MDKDEKIIKEQKVTSEPEEVTEYKKVLEPKTVMTERMVAEKRTVMHSKTYEKMVAATCDKINKMDVLDSRGEKIGSISDIMIDLDSGRVLYAVMSFGGLFNKKVFAIPWEAFSITNREHYYDENVKNQLTLNVPKEKFEESEGFDKNNWPRQPDRKWLSNTYSRYGYRGWWEE